MLVTGWLSGLNLRLRFKNSSRRRSRRAKPVSRFAAQVALLEERCLLATGIPMPADTVAGASAVLWYDSSAAQKTITITNNSPNQIVYPFLEDANSRATSTNYPGTGTFDPFDPINQEYRGYIGYTDGGQNYLGLLPGKSITVNVPLAFWDAGRLIITTDGAVSSGGSDLLGPDPTAPLADQMAQPNAFFFHYANTAENAVGSTTPKSYTLNFTPIYNQNIVGPGGVPSTNGAVLPDGVVPGMLVTGPGILSADPVTGITSNSVTLMNQALAAPVGVSQTNVTYTFVLPTPSAGGVSNDPTLQPDQVKLNHGSADNQALLIYLEYELTQNKMFTITSDGVTDIQPGTTVSSVDVNSGVITLSQDTIPQARGGHTYSFGTFSISPTSIYAVNSVQANGSITNGRVMWYHALTDEGPNGAAPAQLTEITFRGTYFNPNNNGGFAYLFNSDQDFINANDFNLINYDVSYVDSIALPVAMEADDVPVDPTNPQPTNPAYGWVGSSQTIPDMQAELKAFASSGQANDLGDYFPSGQGYPSYYDPGASSNGTKLPSGQNLFLESPFNNVRSVYDNNVFALTSGGTGPVTESIGATSQNNTGTSSLYLNTDPNSIAMLEALYNALNAKPPEVFTVSDNRGGTIQPGTTLANVIEINGVPTGEVVLSKTVTGPQVGHVYDFNRVFTDYSAKAIMSLWYSWAQYYVDYAKSLGVKPTVELSGHINTAQPNQLILAPGQTAKLVPGMAVTFDGKPIGIILKHEGDTITLSQLTSGSGKFTLAAPSLTALAGYNDSQEPNPAWKLLQPFTPSGDLAQLFATNVYVVMSTMSSTLPATGPEYSSVQLLANIVGATVSKLASLPTVNDSAAGMEIQTIVTNDIKSALRGVPDYTAAPYNDPATWYPDPSLTIPGSGQSFNIYNLDPFVWFVHEKLGLSGYGFSVDDDTADVGANGSNHLEMSIGGLGGLSKPYPWTSVAPYGPVSSTGTLAASGPKITGLDAGVLKQVFAYNPNQKLVGALVNGEGIQPGATIQAISVPENGKVVVTLRPPATGSKQARRVVRSVKAAEQFYFFGPVVGTGTVSPGGTTITGLNAAALATLEVVGPVQNLLVSGPGIQKGTQVKNIDFTNGTVTLDRSLAKDLEAGSYGYTFS